MKNYFFAFLLCLVLSFSMNAQRNIMADLVIVNANVRTMDDKTPKAQSIAVWQNKIIAVGTDADTKPLIGKNTRVIDAKGKLVLPGFNDSHIHFMDGAAGLSSALWCDDLGLSAQWLDLRRQHRRPTHEGAADRRQTESHRRLPRHVRYYAGTLLRDGAGPDLPGLGRAAHGRPGSGSARIG